MLNLRNEIKNCLEKQKIEIENLMELKKGNDDLEKGCSKFEISKYVSYVSDLTIRGIKYFKYRVDLSNEEVNIDISIVDVDLFYRVCPSIQEFMSMFEFGDRYTKLEINFPWEVMAVDIEKLSNKLSEDIINILKMTTIKEIDLRYLDIFLKKINLGNIDITHLKHVGFMNYFNNEESEFSIQVGNDFKHDLEFLNANFSSWKDLKVVLNNSSIQRAEIYCFSIVGESILNVPEITYLNLASYSRLREVIKKLETPKLTQLDYLKL